VGAPAEILESIQQRVPDTGRLQRIVLFDRETGARHLSAVLVRLPAGHEFPLHTHPKSEDCFFVLSGSGEALEPGARFPIAAPAGVWIPAGHPHGLRAFSAGMLEVGFQSPADHTAVPFAETPEDGRHSSLVTAAFPCSSSPGAAPGRWASAFPGRSGWRHLDAECAVLEASQRLTVGFRDFECAIVVAAGEVELAGPQSRRLPAFSAIRIDPGCSIVLRATLSPTLLFAVKARASA
jgi:quercetin dioxygenase-like cupin family protein